jgi:hypothetical protein
MNNLKQELEALRARELQNEKNKLPSIEIRCSNGIALYRVSDRHNWMIYLVKPWAGPPTVRARLMVFRDYESEMEFYDSF